MSVCGLRRNFLSNALEFADDLLDIANLDVGVGDLLNQQLLWDLRSERNSRNNSAQEANEFKLDIDCKHFGENELSVMRVGNELVIRGEHIEKQEAGGFVSRQFFRRIPILEDIEMDQMTSTLSSNGLLTIKAPKKQAQPNKSRVIPIHVCGKEVENDVIDKNDNTISAK